MTYVDGPACRLWVEMLGDGDLVTVFAHGLGSSMEDLRSLAERAPGTSVLMDLRGHGRSDAPPEEAGYDHAAMRADVEHVADRFGATCAVGVSMGAGALMNLLADRPDRFERVAMLIPSRLDDPCPDVEGTLRMARELETLPLEEVADRLLALPDLAAILTRDPRWRDQMRSQLLRMNAVGVPRAFRAYATGPPPVADPTVLGAVRAPVLIAANGHDQNHPASVAERLGAVLPNATVEIHDADFDMFLDDLDAFAARLGRFLAGAPAPLP